MMCSMELSWPLPRYLDAAAMLFLSTLELGDLITLVLEIAGKRGAGIGVG